MSIAKDHYLKLLAERGTREHALGETALALVEAWNYSHVVNKRDIGRDLHNEFYRVLTQVWAWQPYEAKSAASELSRAFQRTVT